MSDKNLQSLHVKLPQNYYKRLRKESDDENKSMKKIIMEALKLYWKKQQPIHLKDALKVEAADEFCTFSGGEIQNFAKEIIPEELSKKASKLLNQAEEANIITENKKGYTSWQGSEAGSDEQLWERISWADWSWVDELIKMSRNGSLDNYLKNKEKISDIQMLKNKLLPELEEKGKLNKEQMEEEISILNNFMEDVVEFKSEKYFKELKDKYTNIKSDDLENEMLIIKVSSIINEHKKTHPDKTEKEIINEVLNEVSGEK